MNGMEEKTGGGGRVRGVESDREEREDQRRKKVKGGYMSTVEGKDGVGRGRKKEESRE